jgi:hypothetical protein
MHKRRGRIDLSVACVADHAGGPSSRRGDGTRVAAGGQDTTRLT